jgi:hypothetical protein
MTWTAPTPSDLQKRFLRFSSVDAGVVQTALDEAARMVDASWLEGDRSMGLMLYACHVLTLDGFEGATGTVPTGVNIDDFASITSGSLSLTRFPRSGSAENSPSDVLVTTQYGRRFLELLKRNQAGIVVAASDIGETGSGWPPTGWWWG